jgi:hypothetical protein
VAAHLLVRKPEVKWAHKLGAPSPEEHKPVVHKRAGICKAMPTQARLVLAVSLTPVPRRNPAPREMWI